MLEDILDSDLTLVQGSATRPIARSSSAPRATCVWLSVFTRSRSRITQRASSCPFGRPDAFVQGCSAAYLNRWRVSLTIGHALQRSRVPEPRPLHDRHRRGRDTPRAPSREGQTAASRSHGPRASAGVHAACAFLTSVCNIAPVYNCRCAGCTQLSLVSLAIGRALLPRSRTWSPRPLRASPSRQHRGRTVDSALTAACGVRAHRRRAHMRTIVIDALCTVHCCGVRVPGARRGCLAQRHCPTSYVMYASLTRHRGGGRPCRRGGHLFATMA